MLAGLPTTATRNHERRGIRMPINYRAQYIEDIGFQGKVIPYQNHDEAIKRIKSIYRTTGIYQVGNEKASMIWNDHFLEIWENRNSLPEQLEDFNQWHNKQVKNLIQIQILPLDRGRWRLGIAQKVMNLFLKDLWDGHGKRSKTM